MRASVDGLSLYYERHGRGEPVLFVHGFPLTGALWAPLVPVMSDDYQLIIPDLRGFGRSEGSSTSSMGRYAADLAALLDEIGETRPVVVVGLSMGGYIAFEFYRRYPARVRALVLVDTRATADDDEGRATREQTARVALEHGSAEVTDAMIPKLFAPDSDVALIDEWREIMAAIPPETIAASMRAMAERPDSTPTLDAINRPTLIVVGAEDVITPPESAREMQARIAGSRLEVIEGAGHMTPVEQPGRFIAYLQQFLDDLEPLDDRG